MMIEYWKVDPTGNITLIVETPVPRESQSRIAAELLRRDNDAEQVGFLEAPEKAGARLRLQMMGGEFCGNAAISAAAIITCCLEPDGGSVRELFLDVSGAPDIVPVKISAESGGCSGTVSMPLPESVCVYNFRLGDDTYTLPLVRFPGICHCIVSGGLSRETAQRCIADWCRQLDAEALGLMFCDEAAGSLEPLVYVASTDTAVWESSCASGTAAAAAYLACARGVDVSISLSEPCGVLSAEAGLRGGKVRSLKLTGKAAILGKYMAEIDP
ncbi:MAG: hypothetical protein ACI3VK_01380 [Oscillospiraceae bacterium]